MEVWGCESSQSSQGASGAAQQHARENGSVAA